MCQFRYSYCGAWLLLLVSLMANFKLQAEENMKFHGALVAEPCVIPDSDTDITLDFGTVIDKELYSNTRTSGQEFSIHLLECDLSIGKTVKITLIGQENPYLAGRLSISNTSLASGIALGIETRDGKLLPINKAGEKYNLESGSNVFTMRAFVEGEPDAIRNHTIERGPFSSVANLGLEYE